MKQSTLGTYIRSLRTQNHMTQGQLAEKLNVTDKAVSKWERDLSYPDIALFPKLADILGVHVNDLLRECVDEGQPSRLVPSKRVMKPFLSTGSCRRTHSSGPWKPCEQRISTVFLPDFFTVAVAGVPSMRAAQASVKMICFMMVL